MTPSALSLSPATSPVAATARHHLSFGRAGRARPASRLLSEGQHACERHRSGRRSVLTTDQEWQRATMGRGDRGRGLHEEHIERAVLPNGAIVLSRYLPDPDIVAICIGSRAGARFEDDQTAGVSQVPGEAVPPGHLAPTWTGAGPAAGHHPRRRRLDTRRLRDGRLPVPGALRRPRRDAGRALGRRARIDASARIGSRTKRASSSKSSTPARRTRTSSPPTSSSRPSSAAIRWPAPRPATWRTRRA